MLRSRPLAPALAALTLAGPAEAADVAVEADTALQAYEVVNPWGDFILRRRRTMQTLSLGVHHLQGEVREGEADYSVRLRLRLDADFGASAHLLPDQAGGETSYRTDAGLGVRYVPGFQEAPLDLMYAYVEGSNLAGRLAGFRLGRQYVTDVLGWWSFDGGLVRLTTPFFLQIEVYGGLEQRGGLPLSTSRYERPGIWRGSHADFGGRAGSPSAADYPSYQFAQPAPAFGAVVESVGPSWVHGRLSYRRVYNTGGSITQQFPDPGRGYRKVSGARVSQDRFGYAAEIEKADLGGVRGGLVYDLYAQLFSLWFAGAEAFVGKKVTVGLDAEGFVPTFDADSIWNWFSKEPSTSMTGRAAVAFSKRLDVAASAGVKIWETQGDPDTFAARQCAAAGFSEDCLGDVTFDPSFPFPPIGQAGAFARSEEGREGEVVVDLLGRAGGRFRWGTGAGGLSGTVQAGERGHRAGGDLSVEQKLDGGRYGVGGRLSLYDWEDPLRPTRSATSFAYVLAAGFRPAEAADFAVEWEHDMNRLVGQRFRIVGLVSLRVLP